jgi:hypothetical protein
MTKHCPKCKTDKPTEAFGPNKSRKDGLQGHCRACRHDDGYRQANAARMRATKDARREQMAEYARRRKAEDPEWQESRRDYWREYQRSYRKRPGVRTKAYARAAVNRAVAAGRLTKGPCGQCGSTAATEAHHSDYAKPLDVTWLCEPCHDELHYRGRRSHQCETDR